MYMTEKILEINRYKSNVNLRCTNGDIYNSTARLLDGDNEIYFSEYVNIDSTRGYKGGRLKPGTYRGIVGTRSNGKTVIKLYIKDSDKIKTDEDLTAGLMTLPSEIPNPNHDGAFYVQYVYVHAGGLGWDYSHACLTIVDISEYPEFSKLMKLLAMHEKLIVRLI